MTVVVALEVPLAVNLQRRALAESRTQALVQVQAVASALGDPQQPSVQLSTAVAQAASAAGGRVIVVNAAGALIADSAGEGLLGAPYATPERPEIVTALRDGVAASREGRSDTLNEEILATAVPILISGRPRGVVRLTQPLAGIRAGVRRTLTGLIAIGAGGLVAGLLLAVVLSASFARPLRRLADATTRLGRGDMRARAGDVGGPREIAETAGRFDEMATRLEQHVRAQREFAANASHQLRTPLTGMKLRLETAAAKAPPDVRHDIEAADREVDRLAEIVDGLLALAAGNGRGGAASVDVDDAVRRAAERWRETAAVRSATIEVRTGGARAMAERVALDQIIDNLVDNATRYAPGPLVLETGLRGEWAWVAVADAGPGIAPAERSKVLDRFYRGRGSAGQGSGLGLAIVRELTRGWGGDVEVGQSAEGGARVEVRIPAKP